VKKEQNGRNSLRKLKPTVGCNTVKKKKIILYGIITYKTIKMYFSLYTP
jgi:hypothetical protein